MVKRKMKMQGLLLSLLSASNKNENRPFSIQEVTGDKSKTINLLKCRMRRCGSETLRTVLQSPLDALRGSRVILQTQNRPAEARKHISSRLYSVHTWYSNLNLQGKYKYPRGRNRQGNSGIDGAELLPTLNQKERKNRVKFELW